MYYMKNIIKHNDEISLPKCMYNLKNIYSFNDQTESLKSEEIDINISNQVIKFLKTPNKKMTELEQRQDQLLKKLDILYDRIKTISSFCKVNDEQNNNRERKILIPISEEIVLAVNPDNLPWFLNIFLKKSSISINISLHIHSSVPNEKVPKIKGFINILSNTESNTKVNLRLIFQSVSAETELKLSSLTIPIVGTVNILRYLSFVYPSIVSYDHEDYFMDALLDLCHLLERTPEKNKEAVIKNIFLQHKNWIYKDEFSIVDLAAYNVIKQWRSSPKYVPKEWFDICEKMVL